MFKMIIAVHSYRSIYKKKSLNHNIFNMSVNGTLPLKIKLRDNGHQFIYMPSQGN